MPVGFANAAWHRAVTGVRAQLSGAMRPRAARGRQVVQSVGLMRALLALACLAVAPVMAADVQSSLLTTLQVIEGRYLSVRVQNTGDAALVLDVRDTALDPVQAADVLSIGRPLKGWSPLERLSYVGRKAKRLPPGAADRLTLGPGASASARLDLAASYRIPVDADYQIALRSDWRLAGSERRVRSSANTGAGIDAVRSPPATTARLLPTEPASTQRVRPASYASCTAVQQRDIGLAAESAEALALEAAAGLTALAELPTSQRAASPRYTRWFGDRDDQRHAAVTGRFGMIAGALGNQALAFDCGCDDAGVFAYVYPLRPYEIFLCPVFWSAAIDGTDSRAGTLVHELSHFETVAGTDDHVYTQVRAAELARSNPALAIDNADNYEYFAENTPSLALAASGLADAGVSLPEPPAEDTLLADIRPLIPGVRVEDALEPGERHLFRVEGADLVQLESLHGDADIEIFTEALLAVPACSSTLLPPLADGCPLDRSGAWVNVFGVDDSRYALLALADGGSSVSAQSVMATLQPGVSSGATIQAGQSVRFGLSHVSELTLQSIDGDADLYVFDGPVALADRLLCTANLDAAALDVCSALPGGAALAIVFAYTDASFTLSASGQVAPAGEDRPVDDDVIAGSSDPDSADGPVRGGGAGVAFLVLLAGGGFLRRLGGVALATMSVTACTQATTANGADGSLPVSASNASDQRLRAHSIELSLRLIDASTGRIRVEALNDGYAEPVKVLLWNGPFESTLSSSSVFQVDRDGEPLDYRGRLVKRGTPDASAWHTLDAGERLGIELDLRDSYDLSKPGQYVVTLQHASLSVDFAGATATTADPVLTFPEQPLSFMR